MDFTNEIKIFEDYIKNNYDFDNKLIKQKYIHTLNVVKVTLMLCEKLGLSKDDIVLAFYLALFHDLGRFREVVRQNEFNNLIKNIFPKEIEKIIYEEIEKEIKRTSL